MQWLVTLTNGLSIFQNWWRLLSSPQCPVRSCTICVNTLQFGRLLYSLVLVLALWSLKIRRSQCAIVQVCIQSMFHRFFAMDSGWFEWEVFALWAHCWCCCYKFGFCISSFIAPSWETLVATLYKKKYKNKNSTAFFGVAARARDD